MAIAGPHISQELHLVSHMGTGAHIPWPLCIDFSQVTLEAGLEAEQPGHKLAHIQAVVSPTTPRS